MNKLRTYLGVTFFLGLSATVLVTSAVLLGGTHLGSGTSYTAVFANSNGLIAGDEVRAAGVSVGTVQGVKLGAGNHVDVTFTVDHQVRLTRGSTATIKFRSLTGTKLLALEDAGTNRTLLPASGTIPLKRTDSGIDLDAIFNSFGPALQGLDPSALNQLSQSIIAVFSGESANVNTLLSSLGSVVSTLAQHDSVVDSLIANWKRVITTLEPQSSQFSQTLVNLQALVHGLSTNRKLVVDSLTSIADLANNGAAYIEGIRPGLATAITQAGRTAAGINSTLPTLKHYLQIYPGVLKALGRLGSYGAFYGIYFCGATAKVTVPGGTTVQLPWGIDSAPRCHAPQGGS